MAGLSSGPAPETPVQPSAPHPVRLLDLEGSAGYLSISTWGVRDLIANGTLRRVRIPLPNYGEIRKVLLDVRDLDALIERWKEPAR